MKKKTIVISAIAAFVAIGVIGTAVGGNSSNSSQAPENLSVSETNSSQSKDNEGKQGEEVSSSVNGEQTADDETSIGIDGTLHAEDFDFSIKDIKWTDALELLLERLLQMRKERNCCVSSSLPKTQRIPRKMSPI